MLYFTCVAGYNLYYQFTKAEKYSLADYFQIFCDGFIVIGFPTICYGIFGEDKKTMKIGYLIFLIGCFLDLLRLVIDVISGEKIFVSFINILIALLLTFVILKQFGHI